MSKTDGWHIWGEIDGTIHKFTVAVTGEEEAFAVLKRAYPGVKILSRHTVDASTIENIGLLPGKGIEWVPLDRKDKMTVTGGVPIDKPMTTKR